MDDREQNEEIIRRLLVLFRGMQSSFGQASAELGLSPAEARTIHWLETPSPMGAMAGALHCDASYITVLSDRLESVGLVERVPDPSDRRVRQLVLTKDGRRMRTRLITKVHSSSPALATLDARQRDQLLALLRLIPERGAEQSGADG